jgi:proline dehydrogenase
VGLLFRFASQWVAGEDAGSALERAAERNRHGMGVILNALGEHYADPATVEAAVLEYLHLVEEIGKRNLDACLSVKPTQLGLLISEAHAWAQLERVVAGCRRLGLFLWMDMESSAFTDATLRLYRQALAVWPRTGVCLQANLRRTRADLEVVLAAGGHVRLVKGAYREDAGVAFRDRREIDASTLSLTEILFQRGEGFAIGSHDMRVVDKALTMSKVHPKPFEFQFLLGVREPLKRELVAQGHRVVEYVPYGPNWLPYFARRLRERPRNVLTMLRSLLSG